MVLLLHIAEKKGMHLAQRKQMFPSSPEAVKNLAGGFRKFVVVLTSVLWAFVEQPLALLVVVEYSLWLVARYQYELVVVGTPEACRLHHYCQSCALEKAFLVMMILTLMVERHHIFRATAVLSCIWSQP